MVIELWPFPNGIAITVANTTISEIFRTDSSVDVIRYLNLAHHKGHRVRAWVTNTTHIVARLTPVRRRNDAM